MPATLVSDTLVANDPRCDFCLLTSSSNKAGVPEDLLFCKDCQAKGEARVESRGRNNSNISGGQQDYLVGKSGSPQIYMW